MTQVKSNKFYLPFALPKYGNAIQQNAYFVQSAGQYLMPMKSFAYAVVENFGGVVVNADTRHHNVEFKVVNGKHFMQIMKGMGINITHMENAQGGIKCFKDGELTKSVCFIQKKTVKGTGCVEYTAVLAMRQVAHELFVGVFPQQDSAVDQAQQATQQFIEDAFTAPVDEPVDEMTQMLDEAAKAGEQAFDKSLPFQEVTVTADDLPAGL